MSTPMLILSLAVVVLIGTIIFLVFSKTGSRVRFNPSEMGEADDAPSLKDPVTALYNKQHLMQRLQEMMARCDRDKKNMALVIWDIDGFVAFNDEFGKKEGDRLLRQVGNSIKKTVRVYDEIFRSGPDEFCAMLTPADDEIAAEVTRRVSELVSKELFEKDAEYAERDFSLTAGYVFYPSDNRSPDALLHAANQALYKSRLIRSASQ